MVLGSLGYNLGGRRIYLLFVMRFLLILLGLYSSFGSLLVKLDLSRWKGKYVLSFVCCGLGVYVIF